mmetsp:Transcript_19150/g.73281  ORF Transcript_19150/g.73281 Transcript_19150/m.73281 type:complete len:219 (+) Transcript_19150:623-1279(+)
MLLPQPASAWLALSQPPRPRPQHARTACNCTCHTTKAFIVRLRFNEPAATGSTAPTQTNPSCALPSPPLASPSNPAVAFLTTQLSVCATQSLSSLSATPEKCLTSASLSSRIFASASRMRPLRFSGVAAGARRATALATLKRTFGTASLVSAITSGSSSLSTRAACAADAGTKAARALAAEAAPLALEAAEAPAPAAGAAGARAPSLAAARTAVTLMR